MSRTTLGCASSGLTVFDSGEMGGERGARHLPVWFELAAFMVKSIDDAEDEGGKLS